MDIHNFATKLFALQVVALISITSTAFSQNQGNIWYFGGEFSNQSNPGAGLDFNSGLPVALTNSAMGYTEGCASYCNTAGELMFYANGDKIYDKSHAVMQNGTGLGGHWSTAQSSLVVPITGDTSRYYLFTNDGLPTSLGTGLYYSIIDMTVNGGLGGVTTKAVPLLSQTGEQLTGTAHANGSDFWVITTDYDSTIFNAFQVSPTGVYPPIKSDLGYTSIPHNNMVMSPLGNKIALKAGPMVTLGRVLFDFDNSTGIISNPYLLNSNNLNVGCVFSPDGKLFYDIQSFLGPDSLIQYDLTSPNILESKLNIALITNEWRADMKVGPDGRIYIPKLTDMLDVIANPNMAGIGCTYLPDEVSLAGRFSGFQLPNIILHACGQYALSGIDDSVSICEGDSIFLEGNWQNEAGIYIDTLKRVNGCDSIIIEMILSTTSTTVMTISALDSICDGDEVIASVNGSYDAYNWSTGETTNSIVVAPSVGTTYSVTAIDSCGLSQATHTIVIEKCYNPSIHLANIFSPNDDGVNDLLRIDGYGIIEVDLVIYSRWGDIVFQTNDTNAEWDGRINSRRLNTSVLHYRLKAELKDGTHHNEYGNITLVR